MSFESKMQRTTIVLAVVAVALGAFIAFEQGTLSSGELAERRGRLLTRFVRARVDRVVIEREGDRIVLEREREDEDEVGEWNLVEPVAWPADLDAIDTLLGALEWASARRTLEGIDAADRTRFGFDAPALTASFRVANQEVPLTFGGQDALESGLYLTLDDETTAYVVGQDLFEALDHDVDHFRERALLSRFGTSTVTALEIEGADGTLRVEKRDGRFHLDAPIRGFASDPKIREILLALGAISATRFVDEAPDDLAAYGLDAPTVTVRLEKEVVEGADGTLVLRFGAPCEQEDEEEGVHARVDEGPVVCVAPVDALSTPASALRESRLVTTDEGELERMTITQGGRTFVVTRDEEDFSFHLEVGEGGAPVSVDEGALADFLRDLRSVRATAYRERTGAAMSTPWLTLAFVGGDGDQVEEIRVGAPSATGLVAERGDEPVLLTLPPEAEEALTVSALRFRSRRLIDDDRDAAVHLSVAGAVTQVVERDGLVWRLTAPASAEAERTAVRDAIGELSSLEAVRFEAERGSAAHGFGGFTATARFETSDDDDDDGQNDQSDHDDHAHEDQDDDDDGEDRPRQRSYTLEIGAETEGGAFARLDGNPAVFVITMAVVDALRADFIALGVLGTELDQLAGLSVERAGLTVSLSKEDDGWHTADGGFADRERTRELADGVAVLRATGVASYGAPTAAQGLAAPRARVTVRRHASAPPPTEYTLLIGAESAEGDTPRTYVRRDDLDLTFLVPSETIRVFDTYSP